jgi:hypothetical protein
MNWQVSEEIVCSSLCLEWWEMGVPFPVRKTFLMHRASISLLLV